MASDQSADPGDRAELVVVNKQELAEALRCSRPTVDALLRRYGDFPVLREGKNGEAWQFDLAMCMDFLQQRRAEEKAGTARRSELLAQIALPIDDVTPDLDPKLTPSQRLALARARAAERDLAMKSGLLAPTSEVRVALSTAFAKLQGDLRTFLRQLARDHDWPDAVLRRHEAELADLQRRFVTGAAHYLGDQTPADAREFRLV
jgi:phage terminase Nu1 subunit (DNA packaging protein)